jgi:hypothetical protein
MSGEDQYQPSEADESSNTNTKWPICNEAAHAVIAGSFIASVMFVLGECKDVDCFSSGFIQLMIKISKNKGNTSSTVVNAVHRVFHIHYDIEYAEWLRAGLASYCWHVATVLLPPLVLIWETFLSYLRSGFEGLGMTASENQSLFFGVFWFGCDSAAAAIVLAKEAKTVNGAHCTLLARFCAPRFPLPNAAQSSVLEIVNYARHTHAIIYFLCVCAILTYGDPTGSNCFALEVWQPTANFGNN